MPEATPLFRGREHWPSRQARTWPCPRHAPSLEAHIRKPPGPQGVCRFTCSLLPRAGGLLMLVPSRRSPDSAEPRPLIAPTASSPRSGPLTRAGIPACGRKPARPPRPLPSPVRPIPLRWVRRAVCAVRGLAAPSLTRCRGACQASRSPAVPPAFQMERGFTEQPSLVPCLCLPFLLLMKSPSRGFTASTLCGSS